ncbi:MAG TPA: diguanylate cyclase [Myxococcaceae bacterium]|nr:diguanylate cyclase [Myxococcaceae bacterium]
MPRVLVVDESEAARTQVGEALRGAGLHTLALGKAEAAGALWSLYRPHVVLMAAHAPAFASVAVARRLQTQSRGAVPFVYLLDAPDPEVRLHVLERGHGVDALCKPLDLRELVARVRGLLRLRDAVRRAVHPSEDETAALRDRLTGTWTRRAMLAFVGQELLRCERHGGGFGLLGMELQGFRQFRRAFGRGMADRLVLYASAVLLRGCRESDAVARIADDRFAVLLPSTPEGGLACLRGRLLERFERARFQVDGRVVRTAVSLGCASFPDLQGNARRLLAEAFQRVARPAAVPTPVLS